MRPIFLVALLVLLGGGVWIVATRWGGDAPTEDPATRERIATGADSSVKTPPAPTTAGPEVSPGGVNRETTAAKVDGVPPATAGGSESAGTQRADVTPGTPTPAADPAVIGRDLRTAFDEAMSVLRDVGSEEQARAAAEPLRAATARIRGLTVEGASLPESQRGATIEVAEKALPDLKARADALRGQAAAAESLVPELDRLIADLEAFTKGPPSKA